MPMPALVSSMPMLSYGGQSETHALGQLGERTETLIDFKISKSPRLVSAVWLSFFFRKARTVDSPLSKNYDFSLRLFNKNVSLFLSLP
jgi:hypothetical protein